MTFHAKIRKKEVNQRVRSLRNYLSRPVALISITMNTYWLEGRLTSKDRFAQRSPIRRRATLVIAIVYRISACGLRHRVQPHRRLEQRHFHSLRDRAGPVQHACRRLGAWPSLSPRKYRSVSRVTLHIRDRHKSQMVNTENLCWNVVGVRGVTTPLPNGILGDQSLNSPFIITKLRKATCYVTAFDDVPTLGDRIEFFTSLGIPKGNLESTKPRPVEALMMLSQILRGDHTSAKLAFSIFPADISNSASCFIFTVTMVSGVSFSSAPPGPPRRLLIIHTNCIYRPRLIPSTILQAAYRFIVHIELSRCGLSEPDYNSLFKRWILHKWSVAGTVPTTVAGPAERSQRKGLFYPPDSSMTLQTLLLRRNSFRTSRNLWACRISSLFRNGVEFLQTSL
ncbi:hypothetical protein J6590_049604 [Homalodisca vitripennis]|nr:hypothetical protein J6590_049604 [Homalodisca vitripennis]